MNRLVKILSDDDGEIRDNPTWCLWIDLDASPRTVCGGEAFGYGESGCEYILKDVKKGGITCARCLSILKFYKNIKL